MGRIALVTGGTRGLGLAIALALAKSGRTPVLVYRSDQAAAALALAQVQAHAPQAQAFGADVADPKAIEVLVETVRRELGPIEILVNNAFRGGRPPKKVHELDPQDWQEDLRTNLDGPFFVSRAVLPQMLEQGFGRLVFIGSFAARGEMGRAAYATAKAALAGLSGTIAQEYARQGITSNVVSPGFIAAGAFERLPPEIRERALKKVPSGRAGDPAEVGALVAHLCADESSYLTGQWIGLDGAAR